MEQKKLSLIDAIRVCALLVAVVLYGYCCYLEFDTDIDANNASDFKKHHIENFNLICLILVLVALILTCVSWIVERQKMLAKYHDARLVWYYVLWGMVYVILTVLAITKYLWVHLELNNADVPYYIAINVILIIVSLFAAAQFISLRFVAASVILGTIEGTI